MVRTGLENLAIFGIVLLAWSQVEKPCCVPIIGTLFLLGRVSAETRPRLHFELVEHNALLFHSFFPVRCTSSDLIIVEASSFVLFGPVHTFVE